jgi:hypothetical protein
MTHQVTITIATIPYLFHANMVKRALKNRIISVQKPLSKSKQGGSEEPETLIIDLKRITDTLTINGDIRAQTITGQGYKNPIEAFNLLTIAFKKNSGCSVSYRGVTYTGVLDQLESEDRADVAQGFVNSSNVRVSDIPSKVKCTMSFLVGVVR